MTVQLKHHYVKNSISSLSSYSRTAVLLTSVSGCGFSSVATLAGLSTIMPSSGWVDFSVNQLSKVSTCLGWGVTTLAVMVECDLRLLWAHLAASFQVVLLWVYSTCGSANGSMTCLASSAVSLAFSPSQCARLDCLMPCSSGGHF